MTNPELDPVLAEVIDELNQQTDALAASGSIKPSQAKFARALHAGAVRFLIDRLREKGYRLTVTPIE